MHDPELVYFVNECLSRALPYSRGDAMLSVLREEQLDEGGGVILEASLAIFDGEGNVVDIRSQEFTVVPPSTSDHLRIAA